MANLTVGNLPAQSVPLVSTDIIPISRDGINLNKVALTDIKNYIGGGIEYIIGAGTSSAYTISPVIPITAYIEGQRWEVKFPLDSIDNPTLAVSGLASKNLVIVSVDGSYQNAVARDIITNFVTEVECVDTGAGVLKFLLKFSAVEHSNLSSLATNTALTTSIALGRTLKSASGSTGIYILPKFSTFPLEGSFELLSENITSMQILKENASDVIDYYGINLTPDTITGAILNVQRGTHLKFTKTVTSWQIVALNYIPLTQIAKAWVNFDGTLTGTITPRSGLNVTSVTKNATGDYTINFTNPLPSANFCATGSSGSSSGFGTGQVLIQSPFQYTVSSYRFQQGTSANSAGTGAMVDSQFINVVIYSL